MHVILNSAITPLPPYLRVKNSMKQETSLNHLWFTAPIAILLLIAAGGGLLIKELYRDVPDLVAQAKIFREIWMFGQIVDRVGKLSAFLPTLQILKPVYFRHVILLKTNG